MEQPAIHTCFLHAIIQQTFKNFEVTVIDNGSRDGTFELIEERFDGQFRLVRNAPNEGYCRTHNTAIAVSGGRYVLTPNPEVVLAPRFLEHAVEAIAAEPRVGAAWAWTLRMVWRIPVFTWLPVWTTSGMLARGVRHA